MTEPQQQANDVVQILMLDVLIGPFRQWLATRGLQIQRVTSPEYAQPTFIVVPTDETLRAA